MRSVAFFPDGAFIVSVSNDYKVKIGEKSTRNFLKNFKGRSNDVNSVDFSPDGAFIVSGSNNKTIKLRERSTGNLQKTFLNIIIL